MSSSGQSQGQGRGQGQNSDAAATVRISQFTGTSSHLLTQLTTHSDNIRTFIKNNDIKKLKLEKINSDRVVDQLGNLVDELKDYRSQIDESKHRKFDTSTEPHIKLIYVAIKQYKELLKDFKANVFQDQLSLEQPSNYSSGEYGNLKTLRIDDLVLIEEECRSQESQLQAVEQIEGEINDIHDLYDKLGMIVHSQSELVDHIESNVEDADVNVSQARRTLAKAEKYKTVWYPVTGAVIGACVGGPIGLAVGLKVAGLALLGGSVVGFTGGRILKKKKDASIIVDPVLN